MKKWRSLAIFIAAAGIVFLLWVAKAGKENIVKEVKVYRQAEVDLTKANMVSLEKVIASFLAQEGRTPDSLKELRAFQVMVTATLDAWGTAIKYEKVSDDNFRLISAGKDKAFNTSDDIIINY